MKRKKLLLLSLLTISTMAISATVYAENEDKADPVIESTSEQIENVTEENSKEVKDSSDLAEDVKEENTKDTKDIGNGTIPESEIIKNDDTGIPDKALYDLILKAVWNDSDGILTKEEAKSVVWLHTNYGDSICIKNLKGIEYCVNLNQLFLNNEGNQIVDLTPVSSLTQLSTLVLYNNKISDLSPITNMTSLTTLGLGYNQISNLSPLKNLTGLNTLLLYNNQISDISPIASLTSLTSLNLSDNQIGSIDSIANLTKLESLSLDNNKITSLPNLTKLTNLYPGRYTATDDNSWYVAFYGNAITLSDAKKNLPECLTSNAEWMNGQKFIEDTAKEQLGEEIKNIESQNYDSSKFTTDSWNAFSSALSNAKAILAKETTNEEYKKAYDNLKSARDNLKLKETQVSDGNVSKSNTNVSNTNQTNSSPKTGDSTQGILFVILALGSVGTIIFISKKRAYK